MLARDAENLYWMARYLERAENTARLIIKITDTLLDLPQGATLGWNTMLQVVGLDNLYEQHYTLANENDIMHFLIADARNPSAILTCVRHARENTRTLREMLPEDLWERINGLYLYIQNNINSTAVNRRNKYLFLQEIINQRNAIVGLIAGSMEQGDAYHFIRLGRNIERADMTTRIMDVNYAVWLPQDHPLLEASMQIFWVGILKSLSAFQSYRRLKTFHVNMPDVVDFLFQEQRFPRSVKHCLIEMENCLMHLHPHDAVMQTITIAQHHLSQLNTRGMDIVALHDLFDLWQLTLANIHTKLSSVYFGAMDEAIRHQAQNA